MRQHPPTRVSAPVALVCGPWPVRPASSTTATWATSATQVVYDLDLADTDPEVAAAVDELLASERFAAFGPDTLAEARNRGYRPHRSIRRAEAATTRDLAEPGSAVVRAIDVHVHPSTPEYVDDALGDVRPRLRGVLPHRAAAPRRRRDGRRVPGRRRARRAVRVGRGDQHRAPAGHERLRRRLCSRASRRVRRLRVGRSAARATPRSSSSNGRCATSACAG